MKREEFRHEQNQISTPKVVREGDNYFIATPLGSKLKIDSRIAKIISIAMRVQARINSTENQAEFRHLIEFTEGTNCHKMALFLRGEIPFDHLVNKNRSEAGHRQIYLLENKFRMQENIFWTYDELEKKLRQSNNIRSVHLLRVLDRAPYYLPSHSFVWLGRDEKTGEEICFHKTGPGSKKEFEITSFDKVIEPYKEYHPRVMLPEDTISGFDTEYLFATYPII